MNLDEIRSILAGKDDPIIRLSFIESHEEELEKFCELMHRSFIRWSELDRLVTKNKEEKKAYTSALVYTALHSKIVSLKLLMSGLLVPAGNTQRYALECIALAFLCSRPSLGVLERYMDDKYSTNKAIRDIIKHHKKLDLDREALKIFEASHKFYDKYSHPTRLSLASVIALKGENSALILGGSYDPAKDFAYRREIDSRLGLAGIFINIIESIESNYRIEA